MIEKLEATVAYLKSVRSFSPKIALVLGSGMGTFSEHLTDKIVIPYNKIPHFKNTSVDGHEGKLILGKIKSHGREIEVVVLQGRLHSYEGIPLEDIVLPVRALAKWGMENLILTNAAGGINSQYNPGDLVLISDHINLSGKNPLIGPNYKEFGPRFPDMSHAYDPHLIKLFQLTAKENNYSLKTGVYCFLQGPSYETPAEIRMLKILGADMVGMSTVPETITAAHMKVKVVGISCITNMAAGIENKKIDHDDVKVVATNALENFSKLISGTIGKICTT